MFIQLLIRLIWHIRTRICWSSKEGTVQTRGEALTWTLWIRTPTQYGSPALVHSTSKCTRSGDPYCVGINIWKSSSQGLDNLFLTTVEVYWWGINLSNWLQFNYSKKPYLQMSNLLLKNWFYKFIIFGNQFMIGLFRSGWINDVSIGTYIKWEEDPITKRYIL